MLYSTTCTFETDYGIQHTLTIEVDSDPELSQELVELVEDAFFDAVEWQVQGCDKRLYHK